MRCLFVITLIIFSSLSMAHAGSKKRDVYARYYQTNDATEVWALKSLVSTSILGIAPFIVGLHGDHTYYCEKTSGGSEHCYSRTGGKSHGRKLSDTGSKQNNTNVRCVYDNAGPGGPCSVKQEEKIKLFRRGTCHQETNHALRTGRKGGPTVHDASGYWVTKLAFTTYGRYGLEESCKDACNN